MRECPFWSNIEEHMKCFEECVMHKDLNSGEECVFTECLDHTEKIDHLSLEKLLEQVAVELVE